MARVEITYCEGKVRYDKKGAQTARNLRRKEARLKLRIYPCPKCGGWHLTKARYVSRREWDRINT